jgi:hypothetical protein
MPYLGNTAGNRFVAAKAATQFSGDGSNTSFTLEHSVGSDEDILVSVDGVIQEPSVAYAVSNGTTLTFTAAPSNNSGNNIFVYYLFRTVGTVSHPSNNALQASDITVDTTTLVTDSTNNRVGVGTASPSQSLEVAGNIFVNTSGNPNLTVKTSGAGNNPTIRIQADTNYWDLQTLFSNSTDDLDFQYNGTSTMKIDNAGHITKPLQSAFLVRCGSGDNDNIPINAGTTLSFTTEIFDQNSDFDLGNNLFTAPVTGKYQLNMSVLFGNGDTGTDYIQVEIQASNRSFYYLIDPDIADQDLVYFTATTVGLMDMDANDTAKIVVYMNNSGAAQMDTLNYCYFSGHLVA